jgi:hypothetical protein
MSLDGITRGADGGRNEATTASVESGAWLAWIPMKKDATIKIVRGVIVACRSSCLETRAPATANRLA